MQWRKKVSITSEIIFDLLKTLDHLGMFICSKEARPVLILDGHICQLKLPFLAYINDAVHTWVIYIGVPYGRLMWKVGNLSEQNGAYTIVLGEYKKGSLKRRRE